MKKLRTMTPLLVLFISLNCTNQTPKEKYVSATNTSEKLYVEQRHYYLGEISKTRKDSVKFRFTLKNLGSSFIKINKIDVSCNCLKIKSSFGGIPPKDSVLLEGKAGLQDQDGHISKAIFINYNKSEILILRVIGDIK